MTYVRALVAAILGAVLGTITGAVLGTMIAPLFGFTSFEGGSGLFAAYATAPAGALIGFVLAAAIVLSGQSSFGAFARRLAIFFAGVAAIGGSTYWYLAAQS